jgi:hypothetical protein
MPLENLDEPEAELQRVTMSARAKALISFSSILTALDLVETIVVVLWELEAGRE